MFIAGADLKELASLTPSAGNARGLTLRGLNFIGRFEKLPCPTVALVDGSCMGGGTELALAMDYRLAGSHPKCEIALPETKIGIIPGWGGTQRLPRLIGPSLALEMICTGEPVKAQRAREIGLVWDAVPSEKILEEGLRLLAWSRESGDWKKIRVKKQQTGRAVGRTASIHVRGRQGTDPGQDEGQFPAPLAALEAVAKGCNLKLEEGLKIETITFCRWSGARFRAI